MQPRTRAAKPEANPPRPSVDDVSYWRLRSDEALEVAYELKNATAISKMLEIGRRYERLARRAEQRRVSPGH